LALHTPDHEADRRRGRALILAELVMAGADVFAGWVYSARRARLCDVLAGTHVRSVTVDNTLSADVPLRTSIVDPKRARAWREAVRQWGARSRLRIVNGGAFGGMEAAVHEEAAWFDNGVHN
jgi:hypothetical protein